MHSLIRFVFSLALLQLMAGPSFAVTPAEMKSAVESRYRITVPGFFGNFKEIGSVLVVRKEGLRADRPRAFFRANVIKGGRLVTTGGGDVPLGDDVDGKLGAGDRLYLYKIETGGDYVDLGLFTVKEFMVTGSGTKGPIQLQATTRFQYDGGLAALRADQVLDDISAWFSTEGGANNREIDVKPPPVREVPQVPGKAKPRMDDSSSKTVKLGQTPEEVVAVMGLPDRKVLLGAKSVYIYGNMKLIFIDGRLTDAE